MSPQERCLRQVGLSIFAIGLVTLLMHFVHFVPALLSWMYIWGDSPAWGIQIGSIVLGALLWFLGHNRANAGN
jgi:hypothetical protein